MNTHNTAIRTLRHSLAVTLAIIGLGGAALASAQSTPAAAAAQSAIEPGRHGMAASGEQRHARWAEHAAKRTARLHDSLKLSPAQEPAWASFVASSAAQRGERGMRGGQGARAAWQGLSAPARMEQRLAMAKAHIAHMETRLAGLNTFYAVLTPEQKKLFDDNSMQGRHHGHRSRRHSIDGRHGQDKLPG